MTHRDYRNPDDSEVQADGDLPDSFQEICDLLIDHGFDGMARAMQTLFNEAMKIERSQVLGAQPYQRSPRRRGYANGYKPKTVQTRVGALELDVPQTRASSSTPRRWNAARAASELSNWRSPRCICKASRRAR